MAALFLALPVITTKKRSLVRSLAAFLKEAMVKPIDEPCCFIDK
jgi:hypothetical protein